MQIPCASCWIARTTAVSKYSIAKAFLIPSIVVSGAGPTWKATTSSGRCRTVSTLFLATRTRSASTRTTMLESPRKVSALHSVSVQYLKCCFYLSRSNPCCCAISCDLHARSRSQLLSSTRQRRRCLCRLQSATW